MAIERMVEIPTGRYDEIFSVVRSFAGSILGVDPAEITPEATLLDLGAQSLDFVRLVFRLERTFNVTIPRSFSIPEQHTIDTFVRAVECALVCNRNVST